MRKGTKAGTCAICDHWGLVSQHHSRPTVKGSYRHGAIWLMCSGCHTEIHRRFTNEELRTMNLKELKEVLQ